MRGVIDMGAHDILTTASKHMHDRAATYDRPEGERSMGATAEAFNAVTGHALTEEQGWLFMVLLKAVRSQQGAYRSDSYEDGAAYFALAGEAAANARNGGYDRAAADAVAFNRHQATPDVWDEARTDIIGQNGNGGEHYSEVHGDSHVPTENTTDPANWRAGDWVECVEGCSGQFTPGRLYRLREEVAQQGYQGARVHADDEGEHNGWGVECFRFHARPDADGWIKWDGGECPVKEGQMVRVKYRSGYEATGPALDPYHGLEQAYWDNDDNPHDIIAYRPVEQTTDKD